MTPAAIPDLNVTGFTPGTTSGATAAATAAAVSAVANAPASAGQPADQEGAFPAVLQALRTPAKPGEAPVLPAAAQDATSLGTPPPFSLQLPAQAAAASPADEAPPFLPAATDDQALPPDGTNLPLGLELESLLGSLGLPASPVAPQAGMPISTANGATESPAPELPVNPAAQAQAGRENSPNISADKAVDAAAAVDGLPALPLDSSSTFISSMSSASDAAPPATDLASLQGPATRNELLTAALQAMRTPADTGGALTAFAAVGATGSAAAAAGALNGPAPLQEAMPTLQPLADGDTWSKNLGDRLLMMAENGMQTARLKLHPEHLGPLEIRISVDDDGASQVWFSAHHPQTRDAIEQALPRLRELFADQGLNLAQANVDSGHGAFARRDSDATQSPWARWAGEQPDTGITPDVTAWRIGRASDRRVDVMV